MPSDSGQSSFGDYMTTLGEMEGFIESHKCDVVIVVGDLNVDFDRGGLNAKLLHDFIMELDLCVCDLEFRSK